MSTSSSSSGLGPAGIVPTVLIVADAGKTAELADALAEPLPTGPVDVLVSTGGDDTIDLFESRSPRVVVLTATLDEGDAKALIETLRDMVPRDHMVIVLVGDDATGVVRTALDAIDMKPDRFVSRPLASKALRFAVQSGLENVARALGESVPVAAGPAPATPSTDDEERSTQPLAARGGPAGPPSPRPPATAMGGRDRPTDPPATVTRPPAAPAGSAPSSDASGDASRPNASRTRTGEVPLSRTRTGDSPLGTIETALGSSPVILIGPKPTLGTSSFAGITAEDVIGDEGSGVSYDPSSSYDGSGSIDISTDDIDDEPAIPRTSTPLRGSSPRTRTGEISRPPVSVGRAPTDRGTGVQNITPAGGISTAAVQRELGSESSAPASAPLRARWEALADSIAHDDLLDDDEAIELDDDDVVLQDDSALPLPPIEGPRKKKGTNPDFLPVPPVAPWRPGTTSALPDEDLQPPAREPTLIIADPPLSSPPSLATGSSSQSGAITMAGLQQSSAGITATSHEPHPSLVTPLPSLATTPNAPSTEVPRERWSHPRLLSELIDKSRDSSRELLAHVKDDSALLASIDDDIIVGHPRSTPPPHVLRTGQLKALEDLMEPVPPPELGMDPPAAPPERPSQPPSRPSSRGLFTGGSGTSPGFSSGGDPPPTDRLGAGRDFARQLRAKMSQMAQRLFQTDSPAQSQVNVDIRPRHDHHTEIDLAGLGDEQVLDRGVTEIERGGHHALEPRSLTTSPGSWDTQVRERGMADAGDIVRGSTDAPMILARMFAQQFTGRVAFRRERVEKIVFFDQGRPVFASSNEFTDRMGELLVREGKITAAQYERCQVHVAQSGRRMGEILVDFGYLKRRELLPAVRRHVEDILYSLFGWDYGIYQVQPDAAASAERIRLSRHPASLVLEGVRRKLDRSTLEKLLGPSTTVIEVADRERLGGIINQSDLAGEERAALAGFDGHADLAQVARTTGIDVADVLPFAWGLCVLGLAVARRTEPDLPDESTALVGETDLAIDRERVRARWQLVTDADYFALLGVRRDATTFEIRRAYQAARRDFAADCFPNDLRRELAQELEDIASVLDEAFRVLRDDRLRVTYLSNLVE